MKLTTKLKLIGVSGLALTIGTIGYLSFYGLANSQIISREDETYLVFKGPSLFEKPLYLGVRQIGPSSPFRYYDFNNDGKLDRKEFTSCGNYLCSFQKEEITLNDQKEFERINKILNIK